MKTIILIGLLLCLANCMEQQQYKYVVFTEECYQDIFINHNFFNVSCISKTLSKLLSIAIVTLSLILKLPQIIKIAKKRQTTGLSFNSIFFESLLYSFTIAYNVHKQNSFMLYGENLFILFQNIIISVLFKIFDKSFNKQKFIRMSGLFFLINFPFYTGLIPGYIFDLAIFINMGLIFFARVPQILLNLKNKHTGQLAFITVFLTFAGAVARSFTVIVSSTDGLLILLNIESVVLNGLLLFQILIYWKNKPQQVKVNKKD